MAIPTSIKTLLSGDVVEWARIEFKETWDPAASLKTICAFANDLDNWGGGYIVLGVHEDKGKEHSRYELKGIPAEKIDGYQKKIYAKCKLIRPAYTPIIGVETYQGKNFIVIWCPGGDSRPYSSPKTMDKDNKERIHYIRKSSSTVEPTDDEEKDLFNLANRVPFDDRVNHEADISDLNLTLIQSYLKEINSSLYEKSKSCDFVELCRDMNIINTLPEYVKPKNVGLMFFSMEPDKFFPYTQIDVVQFPDGLGGNNIIEKTFKGPIHQQLREALQYIRNVVVTEKIVKHPDRAEADRFFNYPYAAIEEGLANAVYHRAYDEREPIEVRVENDRIEIVSFPGPDRSVTIEGLKNYRVSNRRYRNRRIGDFLKELHLTEGRNTGFKKITDALRANGSPKPEFETDEDRSYFITRLFVHEGFLEKARGESTRGSENEIVHETTYYGAHETAHESRHESRHEGRHESRHDTSYDEQVRQLIDFCDVPRSRSEMQEYLGITSRGYFAYKYIKPLVEEGKLEMTIPDKPQSRNQKYVRAQCYFSRDGEITHHN